MRSKVVVAASFTALLLLMGACSTSSLGAADRVEGGVPDGFREGEVVPVQEHMAAPRAGWVNDDEFGIVLVGSSSCPPVVTKLRAVSDDEISFSVDSSPRGQCTDDAAPRTNIFQVPDEITERPIKLRSDSFPEIDHILLP